MQVIKREGGIRIRSDVKRHRIENQSDTSRMYSPSMTERVYSHLRRLAKSAITAGLPLVVDATFLKREQRVTFQAVAGVLNVGFQIVDREASFEELCRGICSRKWVASRATVGILKMQIKTNEPLTPQELQFVNSAL
ncbi:MAG: putative kinase [Mariniblastus sp.]|jgi:predicted kinase